MNCINAHTKRAYCAVKLVPFRLADDMMNKQILMQAQGIVSRSTLQEALNLEPDKERDRLKQEQLDDHESQREVERRSSSGSRTSRTRHGPRSRNRPLASRHSTTSRR